MIPLLSIVIPTHNRAKYAYHSIISILKMCDERIELIVSDTSTNDDLVFLLTDNGYFLNANNTLKFYRPIEKYDMTGNHNFAISKTSGHYVCLIGDDDTVTTEIIDAAEWARNNDIDILSPEVMANYAWPDFKSSYFGSGHAARLYLPKVLGKIRFIDTSIALENSLLNAAQGTEGLPKIYHGIVKRSLIDQITSASGFMFHGSSPDVSGAIALALISKKFVIIDYPLTIPGASGASNTGRSAVNTHIGKLEDENQTKIFQQSGWSIGVPKFFSVETVWAHAAIETLKSNQQFNFLTKFNFPYLLAICQVKYPQYKALTEVAISEVIELLNEDPNFFKRKIKKEVIRVYKKRINHVFKRALRPPTAAGGRLNIAGIDNINIALIEFTKYMKKQNWSLNSFIKVNFFRQ